MADNTILKGMWCFNNIIDDTTVLTLTFNYKMCLNGKVYDCTGIKITSYTDVWFTTADGDIDAYYNSHWKNEDCKTIVIVEGQEDKTDVITYLQANANKVNLDVEYETPEDYLYEISSLQQSMINMIVSQGGSKPVYSLEQYMNSLVQLRKEFVKLLKNFSIGASESEKMGVSWANRFRTVVDNFLTDNLVNYYDDTLTNLIGGTFAYRNNLEIVEMTELEEIGGPVFMYPKNHTGIFNNPKLKKVIMPKLKKIINTYDNYQLYPTFAYQSKLKEIDMPLLETVNSSAFTETGLIEVNLPNLKTCGGDNLWYAAYKVGVFEKCTALQKVILPKCESLYFADFRSCTYLKEIDMPSLTYIGDYSFYDCTHLSTVNIPLISTIMGYTFYNCTSLESFDFTNIKYIRYGSSFEGSGLKGEIIAPALLKMEGASFKNCKNITKFSAPELTLFANTSPILNQYYSTSSNHFYGCTSLVEIDLPKLTGADTEGGDSYFYGCTSLKTVNLPLLQKTCINMFKNCTSLEYIDLPSVTKIEGYDIFYGCTSLKTVKLNAATSILSFQAFTGSFEVLELRSLNSTFSSEALRKITSLKEIYLDSMESLFSNMFSLCKTLKKVYIPKIAILPDGCFSSTGDLSETDFSNIVEFGSGVFSSSKMANGYFQNLTTMVNSNFYASSTLVSFEAPKLKTMGEKNFYRSKSIEIFEAPMLETIGAYNFYECSSVKKVHFGKVSTIVTKTFMSCSSLRDVYLGYEGLVILESDADFIYNGKGTKIHVRAEYVDSYKTATNWVRLISNGYVVIVGDYTEYYPDGEENA